MNEGSKSQLRVMIFMDGAYVRQTLTDIQAKKKCDTLDQRKGKEEGDKVDFSHITKILLSRFSIENSHVKSCFYDGIPHVKKEPELYKKQAEYLENKGSRIMGNKRGRVDKIKYWRIKTKRSR